MVGPARSDLTESHSLLLAAGMYNWRCQHL